MPNLPTGSAAGALEALLGGGSGGAAAPGRLLILYLLCLKAGKVPRRAPIPSPGRPIQSRPQALLALFGYSVEL
eukprot:14178989-Alexandrium_andersonii.AAC.1